MEVSVRMLKDKLSEYLRRVQAGERVIVTDHDRPVAEIVRIEIARLTPGQRLDRLAAEGEVSVPAGKGFASVKASPIRGRPLSDTVSEDRR